MSTKRSRGKLYEIECVSASSCVGFSSILAVSRMYVREKEHRSILSMQSSSLQEKNEKGKDGCNLDHKRM